MRSHSEKIFGVNLVLPEITHVWRCSVESAFVVVNVFYNKNENCFKKLDHKSVKFIDYCVKVFV